MQEQETDGASEVIQNAGAVRADGEKGIHDGHHQQKHSSPLGQRQYREKKPNADDGQIVVARIGEEATVKRLRRRNGEIWLMPENDAYAPIDGSEAEIIGLVKAVIREL